MCKVSLWPWDNFMANRAFQNGHFHNKSPHRYITKVWRLGRYRNPVYPYMRFCTHHGLVQVLARAKSRCGREITSCPTEPSKMAKIKNPIYLICKLIGSLDTEICLPVHEIFSRYRPYYVLQVCKVPLWPWDILMVNWPVKVIYSENLKSAIVYIHHFGRYRNPVYPYMRLCTHHGLGTYMQCAKSRCGREITSWPTEPSKMAIFTIKVNTVT